MLNVRPQDLSGVIPKRRGDLGDYDIAPAWNASCGSGPAMPRSVK
jgi:hypothetical protein